MNSLALVPEELSVADARRLTDEIRDSANRTEELLHRAHDGRAWKALGYDSWQSYCREEFQMTKQRSFQLLAFVEIRTQLRESTMVDFPAPDNERQVRPLAKLPPNQRFAAWGRAVGIADGKQPTAKQVTAAVAQMQWEKRPVFVGPLPMFDTVVDQLAAEIRGFLNATSEVKRVRKVQEILAVQDEVSRESREKLYCLKASLEYLSRQCAALAKAIHPPPRGFARDTFPRLEP